MHPNLEYLRKTQDLDLSNHIPFHMAGGNHAGWIEFAHAEVLARDLPNSFLLQKNGLFLAPDADADINTRSKALDQGYEIVVALGFKTMGKHAEPQPVSLNSDPFDSVAYRQRYNNIFGVPFYGVHMNVYSRIGGESHMWLARRASGKKSYPDCLDQIAAGGVPHGNSYLQTIRGEAQEEANIGDGFHDAIRFKKIIKQQNNSVYRFPFMGYVAVYDLEVPTDFVPSNNDGEAGRFQRFSPLELLTALADEKDWKLDSAAIAADFCLRHNMLTLEPDEKARIESYIDRPLPFGAHIPNLQPR